MWKDNRKHSTKRVKMRPHVSSEAVVSRKSQYFNRSQLYGNFKPLVVASVIVLVVLQLALPGCCSGVVKSANNGKVMVVPEIGSNDVDVVGYGEDCSVEGPFCDASRHLACDPVDEVCVCDTKSGYVHINDVPGGMEQHLIADQDEYGSPYLNPNGNVCLSKHEIIKRTEQLMGLWNKDQKENTVDPTLEGLNRNVHDKEPLFPEEYDFSDEEFEDFLVDGRENEDILPIPSPPPAKTVRSNSEIYDDFLKSANIEQPEYDEERLTRFKLRENVITSNLPEKELIVEEIMKYRMKTVSFFDHLAPYLMNMIHMNMNWRNRKLSNSICTLVFDVDRDNIFTHQEYVISILSETVRELVVPKVFLDLIQPLYEESCISIEDLQALDHEPTMFLEDFQALDSNFDGCISLEEFWKYANKTCGLNWLTQVLRNVDFESILDSLDPTPEEMYIRRIMQNERLATNWKIIDKDNDGYISKEELQSDFTPSALSTENKHIELDSLMKHLDKNDDGKISMDEVKLQISVPQLTEEYQLEWLESLYELYETDEDEVKEYLEALKGSFQEFVAEKTTNVINQENGINRIFTIFDKNRNGEMDKVEFKLLLELMKKYVVLDLLNETVDSMDLDSNRKLSVFEYEEFFKNTSDNFGTYFINLLALEEQVEEIQTGIRDGSNNIDVDVDGYYDSEEDDPETDVDPNNIPQVPSSKLTRRAAASNITTMIRKLFTRMDHNGDGFVTKEDFYSYASSYKAQRTDSEMREEFAQLDIDKDGVLTAKDAEDFVIPIDFEKYKEANSAFSEEVVSSHLEEEFPMIDINWDGIIQKEEFSEGREILFQAYEEQTFLNWVEYYLDGVPVQVDRASEKSFAEFDSNCDRYISEKEFQVKLNELRGKMDATVSSLNLLEDASLYFQALDLNKDGKVSHNEFQILLLRKGKKLHVI